MNLMKYLSKHSHIIEATYKGLLYREVQLHIDRGTLWKVQSLVYKFALFIEVQKLPEAWYRGTDFWLFHAPGVENISLISSYQRFPSAEVDFQP